MGGIDPRKLVSFRATDDAVAAIDRLVKASGLTKQEYLLNAALGATAHTHLKNADSSFKDTTGKDSVLITTADSSPKFKVGQEITAQSAKTYDQLWLGNYQKMGKAEYLLSNELNLLCKVKGRARSGKKKLQVVSYFPDDEVVFFDDGTFVRETETSYEWFTKKELEALERERVALETTTALEPTNEQIVIEAIEPPSIPLVEPLESIESPKQLTHKEFKVMYGLDDAIEFGLVCDTARANGWVASDGKTWVLEGSKNKARWTVLAYVGELEPVA